jgi:hypothetical protein
MCYHAGYGHYAEWRLFDAVNKGSDIMALAMIDSLI